MKVLMNTMALLLVFGAIQSVNAEEQNNSQTAAMSLDMKDCATTSGVESTRGQQICLSQAAPGSLALDPRGVSRQRVDQLLLGKGDIAPSGKSSKGTR